MNPRKYLKNSIRALVWAVFTLLATPLNAALEVAPAAWQNQQSWWPANIESDAGDVTVSESNCRELLGEGWLISNRIVGLLSGHYSPTEGREFPVSLTLVDSCNLIIYLGQLDSESTVETSWLVATRPDIPTPNNLGINYLTGDANFQNLNPLGEQKPLSLLDATPNSQTWQRVRFISYIPVPANTHLYLRMEATGVDPTQAQTLIQDLQVRTVKPAK